MPSCSSFEVQLRCVGCVSKLKQSLGSLQGIERVSVSLGDQLVHVWHAPGMDGKIEKELQRAGFMQPNDEWALVRVTIMTLCMLAMCIVPNYAWLMASVVQLLGLYSLSYANWPLSMDGMIGLSSTLNYATCLLLALTSGSDPMGLEASAMSLLAVLAGRLIEQRVRRGVSKSLRRLLTPSQESLVERFATGERVGAESLRKGDRFIVHVGQQVPVDARVHTGEAWLQEALLTGEGQPRKRATDDVLLGGSWLVSGESLVAVALGNSTVDEIRRLVRSASAKPDATSWLEKRLLPSFILTVYALSLITFTAVFISTGSPLRALRHAAAVVGVACPCTLGLAAPLLWSVCMACGLRRGLLLVDPGCLLRLTQIATLAVDKTGTLTNGQVLIRPSEYLSPSQRQGGALSPSQRQGVEFSPLQLSLLYTAELNSRHPIGQAIRHWAKSMGGQQVEDCECREATDGIELFCPQGTFLVGNAVFFKRHKIPTGGDAAQIWIGWNGEVIGGLCVEQEQVDPEAASLLAFFRSLPTVMLTGDCRRKAAAVASALHIRQWAAELSPAEKAQLISKLDRPLFIGDGANDAPAMAKAQVSICLGLQHAASLRAADVIVAEQSGRLMAIRDLYLFAIRAKGRLYLNLALAFGYNLVMLPLAVLTGRNSLSPLMALSSLALLANSVTLLRI